MLLTGLLPLVTLALWVGVLRRRSSNVSEAIICGSLVWAFSIAVGSEALSLWRAITFESFLACWTFALVVLALTIFWRLRASPPRILRSFPGRVAISFEGRGYVEWIAAVALTVIAGVTLFIALACPPNNWDSQTYHLPRIEHWIQNRSLEFYPTSNSRQLMLPGFAEVLILQLRLLSGADRLDNLVQWLAGAGSVLVVGRIALALGASTRGTALARLTAATLPIGILESTSTQNDLVVTFFLLCTAERLLAWRASRTLGDAAFMSIAAGLALATKGTAYPIGLPMGLWFLIEILPTGRRALAPLIAAAFLLLLPNLPTYMRNLDYSGSPIGTIGQATNNTAFGPGPLLVNGARNLALNLASSDYPLNRKITEFVYIGLSALGLDTNDPALSFPPAPAKFQLSIYQNESSAGNPIQLIIAVVSVLSVFLSAGRAPYPRRRYALCIVAATVVFLVVLRWQPWITRLQLSIFALSAPLAALLPFDRRQGLVARILAAVAQVSLAVVLIYFAWAPLWTNMTRPLLQPYGYGSSFLTKSADEILFTARPDLLPQYRTAVDYALQHDNSQIGLAMGGDDWEYPLWRGLRRSGVADLRIEHVGYPARLYPLGPFHPTMVIATVKDRPSEMTINGAVWHRKLQLPLLAIYARDP